MAPDLGSDWDLTDEAVGLGSVGKFLGQPMGENGDKWGNQEMRRGRPKAKALV